MVNSTQIALSCRPSLVKEAIRNFFDPSPPIPGTLKECADYKAKYAAAIHRPTDPTSIYNCHGLTFASRRTNIDDSAEVRRIFNEDAYHKVEYPSQKLYPGDIVLYVRNGDISHSGIIVDLLDFGPRVLSKWGGCHEVVHMLGDCPYTPATFEYWRIVA